MKRIYSFLFLLFFVGQLWAQVPNKISYQAVIRNAENILIQNQVVGMQISILQGSPDGSAIYTEVLSPTTNTNGLISIEIGNDTGFESIDWSSGIFFVKTEIDPEGGNNYTITGVSQILSVPFALHAKTAQKVTGELNEKDPDFNASVAKAITASDTIKWNQKLSTFTELDPSYSISVASKISANDTARWGKKEGITAEVDPIFNASLAKNISANDTAKWNNKLSTYTESDPKFNAWNKSTGINITESQVSDLKAYLTVESDPNFNASLAKKITAADTTRWASGKGFTVETDPEFNNSLAKGLTAIDTAKWNAKSNFNGNYTALSNKPNIKDSVITYRFSGNYNDLSNKPLNLSTFVNDAGYLTSVADNSATNELQTLRISNDTIYLSNGGFVKLPGSVTGNNNPPTATAMAATSIDARTAQLNGTVNAQGFSTSVQFECYSMAMGFNTVQNANPQKLTGNTASSVTLFLSDLLPATEYTYKVIATNAIDATASSTEVFTTQSSKPVIATFSNENLQAITTNSCMLNATLSHNGGSVITARGFCYGTSSNPTLANSFSTNGTGTGYYSTTLTGLTPSTQYYIRAYATNSLGTEYSAEVSFTTPTPIELVTDAVTGITSIGCTFNGNITTPNGYTVRGFCYGTSSNPDITGNKTDDYMGMGMSGTYSYSTIVLAASTTYYVRAYATNSAGTTYGNEVSFATSAPMPLPEVTTSAVSSISENSCTFNGNITTANAYTVRGFCYGTSSNPDITGSKTDDYMGMGITGSFTSSPFTPPGLIPITTYYVRAYATNSSGTAYGNEVSFTTSAPMPAPVVTTQAVSSISSNSCTFNGTIVTGNNYTVRGFCYGTTNNPNTTGQKIEIFPMGDGPFWTCGAYDCVNDLAANTTYYVRAYATNSSGTAYGSEVSFTTTNGEPSVTTSLVTNLGATRVTFASNNAPTGNSITEVGVCWSTSPIPTTANSKQTFYYDEIMNPSGNFGGQIAGLTPSTNYYARAYATNAIGTSYGEERVFTTTALSLATISDPVVTGNGITTTTANYYAQITNDGGSSISEIGICYGLTANPDILGTHNAGMPMSSDIYTSIYGLTKNTTYHARVYAINDLGISYSTDFTFKTLLLNTVNFNGSNLYYTDDYQSLGIEWGGVGVPTPSATSLTDGEANTADIVGNLGTNGGVSYAAKLCDDLTLEGFTDWYLPALNELKAFPLGSGGIWWTSTSIDSSTAWGVDKMMNSSQASARNTSLKLKCVRKD